VALVALGVSGGIGAYKAVEVCRGLQKRGHDVVVVMTRSAAKFVGPLTFEAITRHPVITSQWKPGANADIEHIAIADSSALLLVAPCTANVIGKFANGIADDFLSSLYLATKAPVLLAPAMNVNMLAHDAVQRNLQVLAARGVRVVEPGEGYLACGWIGKGRLAEPDAIVDAAMAVLAGRSEGESVTAGISSNAARIRLTGEATMSALRGLRVLVTAGPTYEDIDPVRFVGNRSSGRMGFAIAAEATRRGARVSLVAGPTPVPLPPADRVRRTRSAADMHAAVMRHALPYETVLIQYSFKLDGAKQHTLSINSAKGHLCRLLIRADKIVLQKDDSDKDGPDMAVKFEERAVEIRPGEWHTVLVELCGKEMVARLDGKHVGFGEHAALDVKKANLGLTVAGESVSFRDLRVWEGEPSKDWASAKAKLLEARKTK